MKRNLAEDYNTYKTYEVAYDNAKDEASKEAARQGVLELRAGMDKDYLSIFALYEEAMERGNKYIDVDDVTWEKNVKSTVDRFREYGVEYFTFSSTWSSAVEIAWLFAQSGCTLEGMVELNGQTKKFMEDEYEKVHGFLFKVN